MTRLLSFQFLKHKTVTKDQFGVSYVPTGIFHFTVEETRRGHASMDREHPRKFNELNRKRILNPREPFVRNSMISNFLFLATFSQSLSPPFVCRLLYSLIQFIQYYCVVISGAKQLGLNLTCFFLSNNLSILYQFSPLFFLSAFPTAQHIFPPRT